jgi:hypothetical protein
MRAHVRVYFGEMFDLSTYFDREEDAQLLSDLTIEAIKRIAALAGQPDFEPRLAGRRWKAVEAESNGDDNADLSSADT